MGVSDTMNYERGEAGLGMRSQENIQVNSCWSQIHYLAKQKKKSDSLGELRFRDCYIELMYNSENLSQCGCGPPWVTFWEPIPCSPPPWWIMGLSMATPTSCWYYCHYCCWYYCQITDVSPQETEILAEREPIQHMNPCSIKNAVNIC